MPVCLHCDRKFSGKEALHQHIKSSSAQHPYCTPCDRRFISQAAYDAHMAAKHPPTFDCTTCNRTFSMPFALDDHYRGSEAHPNCGKCGRGFKDTADRDEHHRTSHPQVSCARCGGILMYEDALEDHYLQSLVHPKCKQCNRGFKDDASWREHEASSHPKLECGRCERQFETAEALQNHYVASEKHPDCATCGQGFKDNAEFRVHMETHLSPPQIQLETDLGVINSDSGFLPVPPTKPQRSSKKTEPESDLGTATSDNALSPIRPTLGPRRLQDLIKSRASLEDATASPVLTLQTSYASPIKDVPTPLFSPVSLPPPGRTVAEAWTARQNVQTSSFSRAPQRPTETSTLSRTPLSYDSPELSGFSRRNEMGSLTYYDSLQKASYPPDPYLQTHSPSGTRPSALNNGRWISQDVPSSSHEQFPSRLASGTGNWRIQARSIARGQYAEAQPTGRLSTSLKYGPPAGSSLRPMGGSGYSTSITKVPLSSLVTQNLAQAAVNWQELMGDKLHKVVDEKFSLSDDISSTQAVDTPVRGYTPLEGALHPSDFESMSSANSLSLPGSSLSRWNADSTSEVPPSSPSLARTSYPNSHKATSHSSNEFTSDNSQSPMVSSPFGLAPLPAPPEISPLVTTPVDVPFAFGNRTDVLDASQSPLHLALETRLPESPSITSLTSLQLEKTRATAPGDTTWKNPYDVDILALKLPESPASEHAPPIERPASVLPEFDGELEASGDAEKEKQATPQLSQIIDPPETSEAVDSSNHALPTPSGHRMHCRICRSDPCEDLTATMCGHIFCYNCITDVVMKSSRCPVCATPTLLYCLFRIDLTV